MIDLTGIQDLQAENGDDFNPYPKKTPIAPNQPAGAVLSADLGGTSSPQPPTPGAGWSPFGMDLSTPAAPAPPPSAPGATLASGLGDALGTPDATPQPGLTMGFGGSGSTLPSQSFNDNAPTDNSPTSPSGFSINPPANPTPPPPGAPSSIGGGAPPNTSFPGIQGVQETGSASPPPDASTPSGLGFGPTPPLTTNAPLPPSQNLAAGDAIKQAFTSPTLPTAAPPPPSAPANPGEYHEPEWSPPPPTIHAPGPNGPDPLNLPNLPAVTPAPTLPPLSSYSPPPPLPAPADKSPEANAAINGATPGSGTSPAAAPAPAAPSSTPSPAPPPASTFQPPLAFSGKSNTDQAAMLSDWLKSQGVAVKPFTIGGSSPYDSQIIGFIDKINDPNTTPAERQSLAQQLGDVINLRSAAAVTSPAGTDGVGGGAPLTFDPATGQITGAPGSPGNRTAGSLIEALTPSSGILSGGVTPPTLPPVPQPSSFLGGTSQTSVDTGNGATTTTPLLTPNPNSLNGPQTPRDLMGQILSQFSNGSPTNLNQQERDAMGSLIQNSRMSAMTQRQALAEQLASKGITGGAASDELAQIDQQAGNSQDQAMSGLEQGILKQQLQGKEDALQAFLQSQGLDAQSANLMASLMTQQNISQGGMNLQGQEFNTGLNFNQQLSQAQMALAQENQGNQAALTQRGQNIQAGTFNTALQNQDFLHLLDLSFQGDTNAKAAVDQWIQQLIFNPQQPALG